MPDTEMVSAKQTFLALTTVTAAPAYTFGSVFSAAANGDGWASSMPATAAAAIVKGEIKGAYQFLSPGSRAVLTSEAYASTIRVGFWQSAVVDRVTCEKPDVCDVHGAIEYDHRGSRIKTPVKETWIKEGSSWWFVQK